jgi:outer membrane PBP1 activator LpoA protein
MPSIYLLIFITFIISSCSEAPKKPEQKPQEKTAAINLPLADKRILQAKQRFDLAIKQTQPKKNQQLLSIVDFLLQPIEEIDVPSEKEYYLVEELLRTIDPNYLSAAETNHFLINQIKLLLFKQLNDQAEVLLDELAENLSQNNSFSTISPAQIKAQKISYHQLKQQYYVNTSQTLAAVKELIIVHPLLENSRNYEQIQNNLKTIWNLMNSFQLYALKQQLEQPFEQPLVQQEKPDNYYLNYQLSGWQQLILIIKSSSQQNKIINQLNAWYEQYPQHMANQEFILSQLEHRFELLSKPQQVALLLPHKGKLAKPAKAIINGFFAAHFEQSINDQLIIKLYDTSEHDSIWPTYKKAIYEGADIVIGPFKKKYISELAEADELIIPTLALNSIKMPGDKKINNLYLFALTPEDEINIITKKAKQNGFTKAAIIYPENHWGKRLEKAYRQQWQQLGGIIVHSQNYPIKTYDYSAPLNQLLLLKESTIRRDKVRQTIGHDVDFTPRTRQDMDVIFMVASPKQAKQIPLQITYNHGGDIPVYSTSRIISKPFSKRANTDLNGIIYTDMPWLLDQKIPAISRLNQQKYTSYKRLFSFGVDSYQILPYINLMGQQSSEQFTGDTGTLTINKMGYIKRQLPTAKIVNGRAVLN